MTLKTSLDAMTHDAKTWQAVSDDLIACARSAEGMHLTAATFSFAGGAAHDAYESVRTWMVDYLKQGARQTWKAADGLIHVRDIYAGTDEVAKDKMRALWAWH